MQAIQVRILLLLLLYEFNVKESDLSFPISIGIWAKSNIFSALQRGKKNVCNFLIYRSAER